MKSFKVLVIIMGVFSILVLTGCEPTDGKVELKEPGKELSDMPPRIVWTVNGPVDEEGNPIELKEID